MKGRGTYKKAQKANTSNVATHVFWVSSLRRFGSGFWQSWASTTLIKVLSSAGHSQLWKMLSLSERTGSDYCTCSSPVRLLEIPGWSQEASWCHSWEPAPGACTAQAENPFFSTCHFYDLLFVFQIFLTFNLTGSDSLLSEHSHVPDPSLILFHEILGFQMHLPCLVCKSFSTKDYGHV